MSSRKRISIFSTDDGRNYVGPFALVTTLFFLWGFAHSILDVLNKHFQVVFEIGKAESAFVQAVVYGGYFLMALPAGRLISRHGYRAGVLTGLLLYGLGALLFIPGSYIGSFPFYLFSLFVIGCGLTCLETSANPYVTVLGRPSAAERRINLAQSFNGLGWIVGPLVGGLLIFGEESSDLALPYTVVGIIVLAVAAVFSRVRLPEIKEEVAIKSRTARPLHRHPTFVWGVAALFLYVAAQTGINSFFINFVTEAGIGISDRTAALALSFGGMGLFVLGRMGGSWLMNYVRPERLLCWFSVGAVVTMVLVCRDLGWCSIFALAACYLFESIMFPTIFSLALRGLGEHTKRGSSILIMSIVGGAIAPVTMGAIADASGSMAVGFVIPLACFVCTGAYALFYGRMATA